MNFRYLYSFFNCESELVLLSINILLARFYFNVGKSYFKGRAP